MLRASPTGLNRLVPVLPVALLFLYGCSDPSTAPTPRIDAKPHTLLAPVVTVTNTDDAGAGSLRQAIIDAPDGATIQFDAAIAGQTIVLSTGVLQINGNVLAIEGPVPAGMTISGGLSSRVLQVNATADVVLRNLSIVEGREKFAGGMEVIGKAKLDHSLVANNEAAEVDGGGIFVRLEGDLTLVNTTVSGNVTPGFGGGIYSLGRLSIRNSTIAFNAATDGGGGAFVRGGSLNLRNSIIANNEGGNSAANCFVDSSVDAVFFGRNLTNEEPCALSMVVATTQLLLPLASNGGPTRTHALGPRSAAIDAGLFCSEATDQRYVARPQGVTCDVGAFEFTDFGTVTLTIGPNVAVNAKTGVVALTGTIVCSRPTLVPQLDLEMSQTQKTTGRFTTIVKATGIIGDIDCQTSPSSWSVSLAPQAPSKFVPGSATGTATMSFVRGFLPATVTSTLKVFQVK